MNFKKNFLVNIFIIFLINGFCLSPVLTMDFDSTRNSSTRNIKQLEDADTIILNPGQSIQDAIDNANPGATILLNGGTYYEAHIYITDYDKPVTIKASGKNGTTIINGRWEGTVFNILSKNKNVTLEGLTITAGAEGRSSLGELEYGGAIKNVYGTVKNCIISGNVGSSDSFGGGACGIWNVGGIVSNCTISNNVPSGFGSGLNAVLNDRGTVTNCTITNNEVKGSEIINGIKNINCAILNNSIIANHTSEQLGRGVVNIGSTVNNCTIINNNGFGGIYNSFGGIVNNSIIANNTHNGVYDNKGSGGGIENDPWNGKNDNDHYTRIQDEYDGIINNCTLISNHARSLGGGIYSSDATIKVTGSNFINNLADTSRGTAIYTFGDSSTGFVNNNRFFDNTSDSPILVWRDYSVNFDSNWWGGNDITYKPDTEFIYTNILPNNHYIIKNTSVDSLDNRQINYSYVLNTSGELGNNLPYFNGFLNVNDKLNRSFDASQNNQIFNLPNNFKNVSLIMDNFKFFSRVPHQDVIYVDKNGNNDNSGTKDNPVADINCALELVKNNGTINIMSNLSINETIDVNKNVTIQYDPEITEGLATLDGMNTNRIMWINKSNVTLNRLEFFNGHADYGAGIVSIDSGLCINQSYFNNNSAEYIGGALFSTEDTSTNEDTSTKKKKNYYNLEKRSIFNISKRDNILNKNPESNNNIMDTDDLKGTNLGIYSSTFESNSADTSSGIFIRNENVTMYGDFFSNNTIGECSPVAYINTNNFDSQETVYGTNLTVNTNKICPYVVVDQYNITDNTFDMLGISVYQPNEEDMDKYDQDGYLTAYYSDGNPNKFNQTFYPTNLTLGDRIIFEEDYLKTTAVTKEVDIHDLADYNKHKTIAMKISGFAVGSSKGIVAFILFLIKCKNYHISKKGEPSETPKESEMSQTSSSSNQAPLDPTSKTPLLEKNQKKPGCLSSVVLLLAKYGADISTVLTATISVGGLIVGIIGTQVENINTNVKITNVEYDDTKKWYVGDTVPINITVKARNKDRTFTDNIKDKDYRIILDYEDIQNVPFTNGVGHIDYTIPPKGIKNFNIDFTEQSDGSYKKTDLEYHYYSGDDYTLDNVNWYKHATRLIANSNSSYVSPGENVNLSFDVRTIDIDSKLDDGIIESGEYPFKINNEEPKNVTIDNEGKGSMIYEIPTYELDFISCMFGGNTKYKSSMSESIPIHFTMRKKMVNPLNWINPQRVWTI